LIEMWFGRGLRIFWTWPRGSNRGDPADGRRFVLRLADREGELDHDDLIGLKRPKLGKKVIQRLTADECRRLIAGCTGKDFRERRDGAIVRVHARLTGACSRCAGHGSP
jgi:hypothetical protein